MTWFIEHRSALLAWLWGIHASDTGGYNSIEPVREDVIAVLGTPEGPVKLRGAK